MKDCTLRRLEIRAVEISTTKPIKSPDDVMSFLGDRYSMEIVERFFVIPLDGRGRPTGFYIGSQGTLTASLVHPREVFCIALREAASSIVVAHNHPSGDVSPSNEDRTITKRLADAGRLLGVQLHDHVIFAGRGQFYSFAEQNPDFLRRGEA